MHLEKIFSFSKLDRLHRAEGALNACERGIYAPIRRFQETSEGRDYG